MILTVFSCSYSALWLSGKFVVYRVWKLLNVSSVCHVSRVPTVWCAPPPPPRTAHRLSYLFLRPPREGSRHVALLPDEFRMKRPTMWRQRQPRVVRAQPRDSALATRDCPVAVSWLEAATIKRQEAEYSQQHNNTHRITRAVSLCTFTHDIYPWHLLMLFTHNIYSRYLLTIFTHDIYSWNIIIPFSRCNYISIINSDNFEWNVWDRILIEDKYMHGNLFIAIHIYA